MLFIAVYRQAMLTAFRETSDALDAQRQSALRSAALDQAAVAARTTLAVLGGSAVASPA